MAAANSAARQVRNTDPPLPLRGALVTNLLLVMGIVAVVVASAEVLLVLLLLLPCRFAELQGTSARRKWLPPTVATTRCQLRALCVGDLPLGEG